MMPMRQTTGPGTLNKAIIILVIFCLLAIGAVGWAAGLQLGGDTKAAITGFLAFVGTGLLIFALGYVLAYR